MTTSTSAGGADLAEVDVEAVGEEQRLGSVELRGDVLLVRLLLRRVGDQDRDQVPPPSGLGGGRDAQSRRLRTGPPGAPLAQPDDHVYARVLQVLGVRMSLAPVPDDRHRPSP